MSLLCRERVFKCVCFYQSRVDQCVSSANEYRVYLHYRHCLHTLRAAKVTLCVAVFMSIVSLKLLVLLPLQVMEGHQARGSCSGRRRHSHAGWNGYIGLHCGWMLGCSCCPAAV